MTKAGVPEQPEADNVQKGGHHDGEEPPVCRHCRHPHWGEGRDGTGSDLGTHWEVLLDDPQLHSDTEGRGERDGTGDDVS